MNAPWTVINGLHMIIKVSNTAWRPQSSGLSPHICGVGRLSGAAASATCVCCTQVSQGYLQPNVGGESIPTAEGELSDLAGDEPLFKALYQWCAPGALDRPEQHCHLQISNSFCMACFFGSSWYGGNYLGLYVAKPWMQVPGQRGGVQARLRAQGLHRGVRPCRRAAPAEGVRRTLPDACP